MPELLLGSMQHSSTTPLVVGPDSYYTRSQLHLLYGLTLKGSRYFFQKRLALDASNDYILNTFIR